MGRFCKDKGETAKVTDKSRHKSSKATLDAKPRAEEKGEAKKSSLRDHVLALGGDDADVEILKDVDDEGAVQGEGVEDPTLSKDVSKFHKGLKLPSTSGSHAAVEHEDSASKRDKKRDKKAGFPKASPLSKPTDVDGVPNPSNTKGDNKRDKNGYGKKHEPATSAPPPPPAPLANTLAVDPPKNSKLLFSPSVDWYNLLPTLPATSSLPTPSASQISLLTATAANLHATELSHFSSSPNASLVSSSSDQAFLKNILASGTLSDRLSALTLMVQSSPLHNTRALEVLKGMADKGKGGGAPKEGDKGKSRPGGRDERLKAARAIVDWWVGGGAPTRKLRYFRDQPLLHPSVTNQYLLLWYFEDWLKKYFFSLLQTLEALSLDTLSYVRTQALTFIFTLLCERPEQEHNLLRLLVNKLGDTDKSICSRASYYLLQLLQKHPVMKSIVIREITALVVRPSSASVSNSLSTQPPAAKPNAHIKFDEDDKAKKQEPARPQDRSTWNVHARYYAAITLNQIVLSTSEGDRVAARALMDVYFRIFREVVGERSVPEDAEAAEALLEQKGKGEVERGGKSKGKEKGKEKGKAKEVQGAAGFAEVQDENSRLVSAILTGVNRAMPFAHFSGADVQFQRHMDTLFLITHTSTFNITLQALTLIYHIVASLPPNSSSVSQNEAGTSTSTNAVAARYYRTLYATLHDARLFASSKQAMYLNLLFKSLKTDTNTERVKAFVKRFCQVLVGEFGGTEFVAGGLWLLGELFDNVAGLKSMVSKPPAPPTSELEEYDPRKRDPQYAHASSSPLWELTPLLHHAHPTLCLLAKQLLSRQPLTSSPDLNLHTLSHFLDRFVYKNPKKVKTKGASAMQPGAAPEGEGVRKLRGDVQEGPVNEEGWWKRSEGSVPVDQLFFHKYFSQKHEKERAKSAKAEKRKGKPDGELDDEDVEGNAEEDSDAEEAEIWKAMKASMPKMGGDDDLVGETDNSDDLPEGLDDSEEEEKEDISDDTEDAHHFEDDSGAGSNAQPANENDSEDALSLAEDSDANDLLDLDADVPGGLTEYDGSDASGAEEWTGFGEESGKSGKRKRGDENKGKRKKLRSLPTFASYEDYARMIEDGPEDNV